MRPATLAAALLLCVGQARADSQPGYLITGLGGSSCATWLNDPNHEDLATSWVLGYWTAVNVMAPVNHHVGQNSDADGIMAEVRLVCRANPSMRIQEATGIAYGKMRVAGR